jgi:methylmalonyl-CoA mutase cobalamin-binding subunit
MKRSKWDSAAIKQSELGQARTFSQVLVQHNTQMPHQLLLAAGLHHHGNAADQIGGLLTNLGALVVQTPLNQMGNDAKVGLDAHVKSVDNGAEAV